MSYIILKFISKNVNRWIFSDRFMDTPKYNPDPNTLECNPDPNTNECNPNTIECDPNPHQHTPNPNECTDPPLLYVTYPL